MDAWCVLRGQELRGAVQAVEDAGDAEVEAIALVRKLARQRRQRTTHVSDEAVARAKAKEAAATAACTAAKAKLQDLLDTMNAHRCDAFPEVQFFMCVQSSWSDTMVCRCQLCQLYGMGAPRVESWVMPEVHVYLLGTKQRVGFVTCWCRSRGYASGAAPIIRVACSPQS